ncbi:MAG: hypothetical protein K4305_05755 [Chlorobium sp.]
MLQQARLRTSKLCAGEISTLLRHGSLPETVLELQHESRLLVMERQGESS